MPQERKAGPLTTGRIANSLGIGLDDIEIHAYAIHPGEARHLVRRPDRTAAPRRAGQLMRHTAPIYRRACFLIDLPDPRGAAKCGAIDVPCAL